MPHLVQPMELRTTPSLARRLLRLLLIVGVTTGISVFALAVLVLIVTD